MNFRPMTDVWILARSKTKYYGAYPAGFLHRARALLGVGPDDPVLHVCAGKVREYPYRGLGKRDFTLDLDPACNPDFLQDARASLPHYLEAFDWAAILIDRPYTLEEAAHYAPGTIAFPNINDLLRRSLQEVRPEGRVGVLDYMWPHPGMFGREVAVVAVGTGRNGRARWFTVFERI